MANEFFFAGTATWLGAVLCAKLEGFEIWIKKGGLDRMREAICQFSDLVQATLAYVAARAWYRFLVASAPALLAPPSLWSTTIKMAVATALVLGTATWLVLLGDTSKPTNDAADRESIERYFAFTTLGFLTGSVGLLVIVDLFAPFSLAFEHFLYLIPGEQPWLAGDLGAVFVFCPALTLVILSLEESLTSHLAARAGVVVPETRSAVDAAQNELLRGRTGRAGASRLKHLVSISIDRNRLAKLSQRFGQSWTNVASSSNASTCGWSAEADEKALV